MTTAELITAYANVGLVSFYVGLLFFALVAVGVHYFLKMNDKKKNARQAQNDYNEKVGEIIRNNAG